MNSSKRQFSLLSKGNRVISGALTALVAASLLALPRASFAAPAVPSPGDSLPRPAGQGSTALENDTIETQEATAEGARFTLTGIQVEHEGMELAEEGLSAITAPLLGREITASELNAAVAAGPSKAGAWASATCSPITGSPAWTTPAASAWKMACQVTQTAGRGFGSCWGRFSEAI